MKRIRGMRGLVMIEDGVTAFDIRAKV